MQEEENINTNVNPLQTNDIRKLEMEMENDEAEDLSRCRKCRILCGRESIMVTAAVLVVGGSQYYIFHSYSGFILIWVDFRRNGLTDLPSSVSKWSNVEYLYLAGNPLCADVNIPSNLKVAKGLCKQQCSADCPADWLGRFGCNDNNYTYALVQSTNAPMNAKPKPNSGCNTPACEYDKGNCPR